MKKIREYTDGCHIYVKILFAGKEEEIDAYISNTGITYKTTGDSNSKKRAALVKAFRKLY